MFKSEGVGPTALSDSRSTRQQRLRNFMISDTHLLMATTILDVQVGRIIATISSRPSQGRAIWRPWSNGCRPHLDSGIRSRMKTSRFTRSLQLGDGYTNPNQDGYPFPDDTYQISAPALSKTEGQALHEVRDGLPEPSQPGTMGCSPRISALRDADVRTRRIATTTDKLWLLTCSGFRLMLCETSGIRLLDALERLLLLLSGRLQGSSN
jgi:hypothetical protein